MRMNEITVGDHILFGRPNGEKTLGKVIKKNRKMIKVETLEARGRTTRGQTSGRIWNVPPSLCMPAEEDGRPTRPDMPQSAYRAAHYDLVARALNKLSVAEQDALRNHFQKQL